LTEPFVRQSAFFQLARIGRDAFGESFDYWRDRLFAQRGEQVLRIHRPADLRNIGLRFAGRRRRMKTRLALFRIFFLDRVFVPVAQVPGNRLDEFAVPDNDTAPKAGGLAKRLAGDVQCHGFLASNSVQSFRIVYVLVRRMRFFRQGGRGRFGEFQYAADGINGIGGERGVERFQGRAAEGAGGAVAQNTVDLAGDARA